MNVEYSFSSLTSLADYIDNKAIEARAKQARYKSGQHRYIEARAEASAYESIAHLIRNSKISD